MKRQNVRGVGKSTFGYTIVEVMIFLAVSGALLISASALISGKQEKTRFTQSVVNVEQVFQDVFNDVSTGYFPSNSDFNCAVGTEVTFPSGATEQGSNNQCIFAGKLLVLPDPTTDKEKYTVYTMVGSRLAQKFDDAKVKLLGVGNPGLAQINTTESNVQITRVVNAGVSPVKVYKGIAIVPEFGSYGGVNGAASGNASRVKLYGFDGTVSGSTIPYANFTPINSGNITVCLQQGTGGRKAGLIVTRQFTIERQIDSNIGGVCP